MPLIVGPVVPEQLRGAYGLALVCCPCSDCSVKCLSFGGGTGGKFLCFDGVTKRCSFGIMNLDLS